MVAEIHNATKLTLRVETTKTRGGRLLAAERDLHRMGPLPSLSWQRVHQGQPQDLQLEREGKGLEEG